MAVRVCPGGFSVAPVKLACRDTRASPRTFEAYEAAYPADTPVKVYRTGATIKERYVYSFLAAGQGVSFQAHNPSVDVTLRALLERVYLHEEDGRMVPPHVPEAELFTRRLRPFEQRLNRFVRGLTKLTPEEFVATCDSRKRQVYENARVDLERVPVRRKDAELKTFVKREKVNFTKKRDPCPRVIQPRDPRYNLCVGQFLRPLEGRLYKCIGKVFGSKTVFKGMNALKQGVLMSKKWGRFTKPVAVGLDAKRFDQHVHEHALAWEHNVYKKFYPLASDRRELARLLSWQVDNKGVAHCDDGRIKYRCRGRRASGDMNTGCGNCLLMCAMVYSYLDSVGLTGCYELANNGDDCVIILEERNLPRLDGMARWFDQMGFPVELERPVRVLEHLEFCQTHPVFDGENYVMVRDPRVCLDKDLITIKPVRNETEWNTLRNAVGLSGLALAGDMPVYAQFYALLCKGAGRRADRDAVESGFKILARGMNKRGRPVCDAARVSFFEAFGVTPGEQRALEEHYASLTPVFKTPQLYETTPCHPRAMGCAC